ncbi:MAG: glycosyltransferase family 2 protein [Bacteroidaceae bacterium]|jgi:glycosyltransferase involved in cell wall biosynthesis
MILGIVSPCYNESAVLPETARRLTRLLQQLEAEGKVERGSFILFVNDGSTDETWALISRLYRENPYVLGISLAANSGHQNALLAGLLTARGMADAVVSIDADLQDDVSVISQMVDAYAEGYEIVYGVRRSRQTDTFFKRSTALGFYRLMRALGVRSVYNHADFRLMGRKALESLSEFKERNLFLRGIVPLLGYNSTSVYYDRQERFAGESKYPLRKMLNFAVDGITSFSVKPVRLIFFTGLMLLLLSMAAFVYVFYALFSGRAVAGWTSIMLSIWFIGSIILLSIGVIGEYIGKIYMEVKERPRYHIDISLTDRNGKENNLSRKEGA